uniref:Uncharacterized protein n=1 Tax=Picea glauca TaxID=3330 RepID=A0A101LWG1_PICGL|nr:hypothetical protein ABT39_MTgene1693 [Picea glauca]QHR86850.1 hypothetical protein Q903MT_gene857 [Picea sitchensis]
MEGVLPLTHHSARNRGTEWVDTTLSLFTFTLPCLMNSGYHILSSGPVEPCPYDSSQEFELLYC